VPTREGWYERLIRIQSDLEYSGTPETREYVNGRVPIKVTRGPDGIVMEACCTCFGHYVTSSFKHSKGCTSPYSRR
jgi:hypothetical protein